MEATAAVARRVGLLVWARPGSRARAWAWERGVGVGSAPSTARRRLLVASLGVGKPLPAQSLGEEAVALEVCEDEDSIFPADDLPPPDDIAPVPEAKTVRVKFVLEKQCAFGEQFLVVGDDPALGHWDPSKATALDWSEGHVWTAKTDLPANKLIEFKYLLRNASGHLRWLPGANRTLRITETANILVVHEDWDHAKKQKVLEEEELSIRAEDVVFSVELAETNGAMLAEDLQTYEKLETDKSAAVVADAHLQGERIVTTETNQPQLMTDKDEKIQEEADDYAGSNHDGITLCQEGALPANRPTSILEDDLAWAGKAMQQVLRILGFKIGTTET